MGSVEELGAKDAVLVRKFVVQSRVKKFSDTALLSRNCTRGVTFRDRPLGNGKKVILWRQDDGTVMKVSIES